MKEQCTCLTPQGRCIKSADAKIGYYDPECFAKTRQTGKFCQHHLKIVLDAMAKEFTSPWIIQE